jgi:hypothetical protein
MRKAGAGNACTQHEKEGLTTKTPRHKGEGIFDRINGINRINRNFNQREYE